jgi:hypothetical protein
MRAHALHLEPGLGWEAAWSAALDELELAVDDAERMLTDAHTVPGDTRWRPPVGLGPLPASLEARARSVLARQLAAAEMLSSAAVRTRRQLRIQEAVRPHLPHPPVYVDQDG